MKLRVLITAGPTREWMDPVRFLSNPSSGAMGLLIAERLRADGANVTVVLGPTHLTPPSGVEIISVVTARDMLRAVKSKISKTDCFISTAAVGDWRFEKTQSRKIKKDASDVMMVRLVKNPDILAWVGTHKKSRPELVVGFALETDRQNDNALKKLKTKNLDLIIANDPSSFATDGIRARWMEKSGNTKNLGRLKKHDLAVRLATWVNEIWKTKTPAN